MIKLVPNQPYYFPQLHWWNRAIQGKFIILDDVQHNSSYPSNRMVCNNGIKDLFITIPIPHNQKHVPINQMLVSNNLNWREEHLRKFTSYYYRESYFKLAIELLKECLSNSYKTVFEYIIRSIDLTSEVLNIKLDYMKSSDLSLNVTDKHDRLIQLSNYFKCSEILMGMGSKIGYMDQNEHLYNNAGIKIQYQNWKCPVDNRTILECIAKHGTEKTKEIIYEQ